MPKNRSKIRLETRKKFFYCFISVKKKNRLKRKFKRLTKIGLFFKQEKEDLLLNINKYK